MNSLLLFGFWMAQSAEVGIVLTAVLLQSATVTVQPFFPMGIVSSDHAIMSYEFHFVKGPACLSVVEFDDEDTHIVRVQSI